jgi:transcriptional regulator with XRE-family HTH domain
MLDLDLKIIGERIRTQRKGLGYSRDQMAEAAGVSAKFCSDIELGLRGMSYQTLYDISRTLHLTADYVLTGIENDTEKNIELIIGMLQKCKPDKIKYIEGIVRNFMEAVDY